MAVSRPHVLQHVAVPKFEASNPVHQRLALLSQEAHQLAAEGEGAKAELHRVQEEIDSKAGELWGLTEEEVREVQT